MRAVALLSLVALSGCLTSGTPDLPVDGVGAALQTPVEDDTDVLLAPPLTPGFYWDETRLALAMEPAVNGAKVRRATDGAWTVRTAGSAGMGSPGARGGLARREMAYDVDALSAEPMPARPAPDVGGTLGAGAASTMGGGRVAIPGPGQAPLRAGSTDDNADMDAFITFLDTWTDRPGVAGNHVPMDVRDRRMVRVLDAGGAPVPGARIAVIDRAADALVWNGTTYGDGLAPFYPHLAGTDGAIGDWIVQAEVDGEVLSRPWDGRGDVLTLQTDTWNRDGAVDLDVVFVIDTTGSMSDEIARIKQTLLAVTERVRGLDQQVDLRYGAVLYRDLGDEYLTRHTPLTHDVQAFDAMLQQIHAGGGGDGPESLNQGLSMAVGAMDWREGAAKLTFLVADAPPHMDYQDDTTYADASIAALARGIRIHTVAASGLDDFGSLVFRQSAQLTRGEFVFIEYGSVAASAADHGVTGQVSSNNLDAILFRKIEAEVEGWGVSRS